jgi:Ni/Fe-hydrogenase subunit HybB-like protein
VILDRFKNEKISKFVEKITIVMVIAGITLSSMHQSSLGSLFVIQIHRLQPLWYSMMQPEFFLVSSMAAGISTIIIGSYVSIWMFKQTLSEKVIEKLGSFVPWILGLYLLMKLVDLVLGNKLGLLFTSGLFSVLYLTELFLTLVAILWFSVKKLRSTRKSAVNGALIVAAGIVLNRFDVTWFAMKSINGVSYFPSWTEIALLVGVTAGIVVVYALIAHFFPLFSETLPVKDLPSSELAALRSVQSVTGD